ncbi:serine/threonine-protein phosphatase CPPED1 isoform X2 [Dermatophagoides farinae]|nr:serine/threonine-protein phosphatase CPPED1-like [Dermatophagoides farinae]
MIQMDPFKRAVHRRYIGLEKENNCEWKGPFRFIQAADTQYGMIHQFQTISYNQASYDESRPRIDEYKRSAIGEWHEEMRLSTLAIEQWNQMKPKPRFVVICGDLVNDFPGEALRRRQLNDFKETFAKHLDQSIPLILLPGNHDILDRPTVDSIEKYRQEFGDDYFAFWVDGVMFLVINAQYYKDNTMTKEMAAHHERWIDSKLSEANEHDYKHIIVFQHIPWFIHDPDEPDDEIFNIAIDERKRMLKKFNDNGIRAIFCGHYHRNAGGHFEQMELIVTSAMGAQIPPIDRREIARKSGYRIVHVDEHRLQHEYVEIEPTISSTTATT